MTTFKQQYTGTLSAFPDAGERFEKTIEKVYTAVLEPGDLAVDVGAHTGKHTLPMIAAVGRTGEVVAFEPIPEKFAVLRQKVAALTGELPHVRLNNCCVGQNEGEVTFRYLPSDPGKSSINLRKRLVGQYADEVELSSRVVRLDDYLGDRTPSFVKIDVEGAELNVLRGMSGLLERERFVFHTELGIDTMEPFGAAPADFYKFAIDYDCNVYDILGRKLTTHEDFEESLRATGVYDYVWIPSGYKKTHQIISVLRELWR